LDYKRPHYFSSFPQRTSNRGSIFDYRLPADKPSSRTRLEPLFKSTQKYDKATQTKISIPQRKEKVETSKKKEQQDNQETVEKIEINRTPEEEDVCHPFLHKSPEFFYAGVPEREIPLTNDTEKRQRDVKDHQNKLTETNPIELPKDQIKNSSEPQNKEVEKEMENNEHKQANQEDIEEEVKINRIPRESDVYHPMVFKPDTSEFLF